MLVKERMTKRPTTVTADTNISKAYQIMTAGKYSQLPVVDEENKIVGLLTEKMLAEYTPSKATTLSVYEVGYILSKSRVSDAMKTDIFTIGPNAFIEDAALVMKENRINSLPVVENGFVIGILTKTDLFSALIDMVGAKTGGARITISTPDRIGVFADIAGVFCDHNIDISNWSNVNDGGICQIVVRIRTKEVDDVVKALKDKGYNVENVTVE